MTVTERSLQELLVSETKHRPGEPLTALMIDGNSIALMAGVERADGFHVTACDHVELENLVEITRRFRHPIFMDVSLSHYPGREAACARLAEMISRPEFDNPVVVLLAGDKVRGEQLTGEPTEAAAAERAKILLGGCLPLNPYDFPSLVRFVELRSMEGNLGITRLEVMRLSDILPLVQLVREAKGRYLGCINALGAALQVARRIPGDPAAPLVLSDLGKLRTLYTLLRPEQPPAWSAIPVGLARDDAHYFKSIDPSAAKLVSLQQRIGNLLFSPEVTPSPLFNGFASSPQIDCTRFAVQISRYAQRCAESLRREGGEPERYFITGRASRMPGLRSYMEARLGAKVRRLDRRPLHGVTIDKDLTWGQVADNVLLLGAMLELETPAPDSMPMLQQRISLPPQRGSMCTISKMKPSVLYVYEQKMDME